MMDIDEKLSLYYFNKLLSIIEEKNDLPQYNYEYNKYRNELKKMNKIKIK